MLVDSSKIKSSSAYIGYLILSIAKKTKKDRLSLYEIASELKKNDITSSRQLIMGLTFLYAADILDFEEANIWIKK